MSMTNIVNDLRARAEALLEQSGAVASELSHKDVRTLIHDLSVHQIELEMQNDDLQWAQQEMQKARDEYANLYHHSPVGYLTLDLKGIILKHNQTFAAMIGNTSATCIGIPVANFMNSADRDIFLGRFKAFFKSPSGKNIDVRLNRSDSDTFWVRLAGRAHTTPALNQEPAEVLLVTVTDINSEKKAEEERLRLEKQLLHTQKLESLGVLAGGIAHDFNNILMAIIGNADLALMRLNSESPAADNLQRIVQSAARAADLTKQMLAYSGKGKFKVEHINLNRLLEEMTTMLEASISKKVFLRFNLHEHLPEVEADATQMRQIVMNLVVNASEAIGDVSGVISISTGCMDCDHRYLKDVLLEENLTNGLYVFLEIADTGCGIDSETLPKVFDPFFTTKFVGRGLGMAAVMGIVRGHKGAIKVYSEPGRGSTFKILLPASNRPAELFNGDSRPESWKGTGTVLLVDDEETVRGIGTEMLKDLGFSTITASDGQEAIRIFRERPEISFVILDLTMPHIDGEQCFRELKQLNPAVMVIMSSGYSEQEVMQKFAGAGLAGFIQKPYRLSDLADVISKAIFPHEI